MQNSQNPDNNGGRSGNSGGRYGGWRGNRGRPGGGIIGGRWLNDRYNHRSFSTNLANVDWSRVQSYGNSGMNLTGLGTFDPRIFGPELNGYGPRATYPTYVIFE
ncbi:hypothetical protein Hanom_Chr09g00788081 [Helianthus anomalus]